MDNKAHYAERPTVFFRNPLPVPVLNLHWGFNFGSPINLTPVPGITFYEVYEKGAGDVISMYRVNRHGLAFNLIPVEPPTKHQNYAFNSRLQV